MPKSELIIFGRSPFLHQADIPALLKTYTTVGFNQFGRLHAVDYLWFFDAYYAGYHPDSTLFIPNWFLPELPGIRYVPKPSDRPIFGESLTLGHKYYTVSLALNWALLQGFKTIYLVGIDHVETDTAFVHHDGLNCESILTPESHQGLKRFVYACAEHADIYQTNPAVKDGWELPFKDLKELYEQA